MTTKAGATSMNGKNFPIEEIKMITLEILLPPRPTVDARPLQLGRAKAVRR